LSIDDAIFEELLTSALYRASELDYEDMPSDKELNRTVRPSLRFKRKMNVLLRSPVKHDSNQRRPIYFRVLQTAAAVIVAFTVLLGATMAVSPTVRAAVIDFVRSWFEDRTEYWTPDGPLEGNWRFNYIPAGFTLADEMVNELQIFRVFENEASDRIFIAISAGKTVIDNEHSVFYSTVIKGHDADIYESSDPQYPSIVMIHDAAAGVFITISAEVDLGELIKIAENIE